MSQNPYQPPSAGVSDPQLAPSDNRFLGQPRAREAGAGIEWIQQAWALFTANPGMWIVFIILIFGMSLVAQFIPLVGPLGFSLISPVIFGGVMLGCHSLHSGGPLEFDHLFAGFKERTAPLIILGALYLVASIVMALVIMLPMFGLLGFGLMSGGAEQFDPESALVVVVIILVALLVALPVMMLFWFATPLVAINNVSPVDALKLSFIGCIRNIVPFLLYGLIGLVIAVIATIPLMLGWLVASPLFIATIYTSYRDIYYES